MKRFILSMALCAAAFCASAQGGGDVRLFEFEAGAGGALGSGGLGAGSTKHSGIYLYLEPRVNIADSPFDVGMQLSIIGTSDTSSPDVYNHYRADHKPSLVTFVDHNWRGWRRVSLFAGAGVGMSAVDWEFYEYRSDLERAVWDTYRDRSFVFNPRVGAEFFNRVRLTVEYKWMMTASEYSFFGLTVGGVFGGGRKR